MQEQILAKLREVEEMLVSAQCTCDGQALSNEVEEHIFSSLSNLTQTVEYYVD